jgi:NADH-quinone oxidoreductase subunit L
MRKMGGLRKYMPITYLTVLIGAIANAGLPPFAGFFSKDTIIEAVHASHIAGSTFAYLAALGAVFVGGFYSFRLVFYAFHGKERFRDAHDPDVREADAEKAAAARAASHSTHDEHDVAHDHASEHAAPHESPWVVTLPLILLAIPSICAGWLIGTIVYGDYFGASIRITEAHPGLAELGAEFQGVMPMILYGLSGLSFWFALAGVVIAGYLYLVRPDLPRMLRARVRFFVNVLQEKYYFDRFNDWFFAGGARRIGTGLWQGGDVGVIDGLLINGSARRVGWAAALLRHIQSGYIYHYAFAMIAGVLSLLTIWWVWTVLYR